MKYVGKNFIKSKYDTLDGKVVVAYTEEEDRGEDRFVMLATFGGIKIKGSVELSTQADLQSFAKMVSDVWTEHMKIAPKIYMAGEQ